MDRCWICDRELSATVSEKWRAPDGELIAVSKSDMPYVIVKIGGVDQNICEICYLREEMREFSLEEQAEVHRQFGLEYRELSRHEDSLKSLKKGLELVYSTDMLIAMALAYGELGDQNRELEFYQKALLIDPDNFVALQNLARVK